jgi:hypothetical protein
LTDTELAAYQRTLYGARFLYQSVSQTKYGAPDTRVILFGAEIRQTHIQDQLRATGGSLYYLSHRDVIQGSEEITLVVRDKNTGLVLSRQRQRQNLDYTIKYQEGRLMFHRPIFSVATDPSLVNEAILGGNPVFIEIDYETIVDDFEETAQGGRFRQQIGDHVAIGGTYLEDQTTAGPYDLGGLDAEFRVGKNTRFIAEYAESTGQDSLVFISTDGGVNYTATSSGATVEGTAYKVAAELDVGEWFGSPDRYHVNLYYKELDPGFFSSGNFLEQGTRKRGVNATFRVTQIDSIVLRHDEEDRLGTPLQGGADETTLDTVQWQHKLDRWGVTVEYFASETTDTVGSQLREQEYAAARAWAEFNKKLQGRLEHQYTISGEPNDQTTAGVQYQALPSLALEVLGTTGDRGESGQAGVIWTRGESSIYLSERMSFAEGGGRKATILGARSPIGPASRVYTEYQWDTSPQGSRTISLLGLQRQWNLAPGFRFLLSGETANVSSESVNQDRHAIATSLSYSKPDKISAITRNEFRRNSGTEELDQFVNFTQVEYQLQSDFTLLGRYRYSKSDKPAQGTIAAEYDERVLGLAYRPIHFDRFNAIAKYTRLFDKRPPNLGSKQSTDRTLNIFAIDTIFEISARLEWLSKVAARLQEERDPNLPPVETQTGLVIQRLNYNVWQKLGIAVEYRVLEERKRDSQRDGMLSEVTWNVMKHFGVGVGYNFTDFSDNLVSQNDYSVDGWFIRVQGRY